jgi:hypothetical protein
MSLVSLILSPVYSQEFIVDELRDDSAQVVEYEAEFFSRYRPNTALDMVRQLPGFQLNDGTDNRGFASAVGNLLINNRRLSAKQDLPSATLSRIPAGQVERIQIIRGQVGGIDLQGQSVVANVFLRKDITAAIRWEAYLEHNNTAEIKPAGSISISDTWNGIEFNAGVDAERNTSGYYGTEQEIDGDGTLVGLGPESSRETGYQINGVTLNTASYIGETYAHLNLKYNGSESHYERPSHALNQITDVRRDVFIEEDRETQQFEIGADAERELTNNLAAKAILLLTNQYQDSISTRTNSNSISGQTLLRNADTDTNQKERILRFEFDWLGFQNHSVQANVEGVYNILDRSLLQTDDTGDGPINVDIPGGNSRVKELRGDFVIHDTWTFGQFEMDYGVGMEISSVTQSGDADQKRNFTFIKPQSSLIYAPTKDTQTRLSLQREISQLNLPDFVTTTVFEDDDLALGNPDLIPETTWIAELGYEKRFAEISVIKVTAFHHWISDVLDLLPLTPDFEAPGNLGNGKRWGAEFEGTVPLQWLGLTGSRFDVKLRWQDSQVIDPVTGEQRIFSGEGGQNAYRTLTNRNKNNKYFVSFDFRQDFESARVAWGWTVAERANRPLYKVNEFDLFYENVAVDAFIETTRWFDMKIRLDAQNITNDASERERTFFTGVRDLTPIDSILFNDRYNGRRLVLSVSGNF